MQTELRMNASWREQARLVETVNRLHSTDQLDPGSAGKRRQYGRTAVQRAACRLSLIRTGWVRCVRCRYG